MNENNSPKKKGFFSGKGFYAVLIVCVAVIGVSGFILSKGTGTQGSAEPLPEITPTAEESPAPTEPVNRPVTDMPKETPTPTATATAAPKPTRAPTEAPTEEILFIRPVTGEVSASFSGKTLVYSSTLNDWRVHEGIDLVCEAGTQVKASADGTVVSVKADALYGTVVEISHADGYVTKYAGLQEQTAVNPGDSVSAGDVIGGVGTTALCESIDPVHLHFEVWKDGSALDPESVLPAAAN